MKKMSKALLGLCALLVAMVAMSVVAFADDLQKPGTVTGLKQVDASTSSIEVEWTADITPDCRYEVWLSTTGAANSFVKKTGDYGTTTPDYYISGLSAGATYYVKVIAYTYDYTDSLYADNYSVTIPVVTAPNGTDNIKQTGATKNSVTLKWDKVAGATGYYIYDDYFSSADTPKLLATTKTNSVTIKNLNSKNEYNFYVYAYTQAGNFIAMSSSYDYLYNSNIRFIPGKVNAKSIKVTNSYSTLKKVYFEWDEVSKVDGYEVQVNVHNKSKSVFKKTLTSSYSTYVDAKNIAYTKWHKAKVRAYVNINGVKKYGAWSSFAYIAHQPDVISAKQVGSKKQVKVKWDTISGSTNYTVYMSTKKNSGYKKVGTTKKTTLTVSKIGKTKLKKNKTYYVYVVANKKVGKTTYSSPANWTWSFKLKK
ncbi:MAG: fibronectin type III domain-containing protein [Lachnospiraceae bacterium]|nr:fibronectin type III domain-containing protein [Lachnospiraceae bacterium]